MLAYLGNAHENDHLDLAPTTPFNSRTGELTEFGGRLADLQAILL
jgi:hypothetical protein